MDLVARLAAFAELEGVAIHCVGGCVRDRLLGRQPDDVDVVAPGAVALAEAFAAAERAFYVLLDDGRGTARVIARDRDGQLDFSERKGDLLDDLRQRDFTINAIACTLADWLAETPAWIDPTGGVADLATRVLRAVSDRSLADDPLRAVRAWRFAAILGFQVEPATRALVRAVAGRLPAVAAERVQVEWLRLLAATGAATALAGMAEDGLLAVLLPGAGPAAVAELEPWVEPLRRRSLGLAEEALALLRFAALAGAPDDGPAGDALAQRFALSRVQRRALAALRAGLPPAPDDAERLARLLLAHGEEAVGALALSAWRERWPADRYAAALARLDELAAALRAPAWVDGRDLQAAGYVPGPPFRPALEAARLAQMLGRVASRDEALAVACEVLESHG